MNPREYAALYEVEDRHWWFVGLRREIAQELSRQHPRLFRWLDAGSGTGGLLANLTLAGSPAGFGVEASPYGVSFSRARGLRRVAQASVEALPFPDSVFDLMTSIDVLCHRDVDEPRALAEAYRCLAPGGILVLQVPAFEFLRGEHDEAVWTNRRYRKREVEALLAQAGFEIRRSFYRNSLLFPAAALRRLWRRRRWRSPEARSDVAPVPPVLNQLLSTILRCEEALRRLGVAFPLGLSIFCMAGKKPNSGSSIGGPRRTTRSQFTV